MSISLSDQNISQSRPACVHVGRKGAATLRAGADTLTTGLTCECSTKELPGAGVLSEELALRPRVSNALLFVPR